MTAILAKLKDYTNPIYEYHLNFWGGIENEGLATELLGTGDRNFWFETPEERDEAKKMLKVLAERHKQVIVFSLNDGPMVTKRTVAKMVMVYDGKKYPYEYDFGFGYSPESAIYMFYEGNYACDCNRSLFLNQSGFDVPESEECGDLIEMRDFIIVYREKDPK